MIDSNGLHPTPSKIQAISHAPEPKNVSELRSFLGILQYYARFIPNLSMILKPLHDLLHNDVQWKWSPECQAAFTEARQALVSAKVLTHYDVNKPLQLATDASPYGMGAVLSHTMDNGEERPVVYASRTLTKTEQNYSQLEKEALALIFAVRKFHSYIYGRRFSLVTDHKPLVTIFGPKTGIPSLAAQRLQRWAIILSAHQYDIAYRSTHDHANADALSRLPVDSVTDYEHHMDEAMYNVSYINELPLAPSDIAKATRKDLVLMRALEFTSVGWPETVNQDKALEPYFRRKHELSVEDNCLLWGRRVVIPQTWRKRIISEYTVRA
jgi:hypothetical protein